MCGRVSPGAEAEDTPAPQCCFLVHGHTTVPVVRDPAEMRCFYSLLNHKLIAKPKLSARKSATAVQVTPWK